MIMMTMMTMMIINSRKILKSLKERFKKSELKDWRNTGINFGYRNGEYGTTDAEADVTTFFICSLFDEYNKVENLKKFVDIATDILSIFNEKILCKNNSYRETVIYVDVPNEWILKNTDSFDLGLL